MGYVIITTRNMLWFLLSLGAAFANIAGIMTPRWLVGYPRFIGLRPENKTIINPEWMDTPTIGIYNRCRKIFTGLDVKQKSCASYVSNLSDLPSDFWKASLIFLLIGTGILCIVVAMAMVGFCFQSIGRKSIFSIGGIIQAFGGLFLVFGLILYPAGWGNEKVQNVCCMETDESSPFKIAECSLGWAFFACLGGTCASFLCAVLSTQAEKSTSSDKVQDEILNGKTLICLL